MYDYNPTPGAFDMMRRDETKDWIVTGWYTPDYRKMASSFARSLDAVQAPYHIYPRDKSAVGWDPRQKASVVLQAMKEYPGRTIILMDVDCLVQGSIDPLLDTLRDSPAADVALSVKARQKTRRKHGQQPLVFMISSRVVMFRPTTMAHRFALEWDKLCRSTDMIDDETALAWTYLKCGTVGFAQLDQRYAGLEVGVPTLVENVVVLHDSAHGKHSPQPRWRTFLKGIERKYFRTGRTKASMPQRIG